MDAQELLEKILNGMTAEELEAVLYIFCEEGYAQGYEEGFEDGFGDGQQSMLDSLAVDKPLFV